MIPWVTRHGEPLKGGLGARTALPVGVSEGSGGDLPALTNTLGGLGGHSCEELQ